MVVKIGVLALQGDFREHLDALAAIGVEGFEVRLPADLVGIDALILPGGESTTMRRLIDRWALREPIVELARRGTPVYGTCAGMIVLAREIAGGEAPIVPLLDVTVQRNAFGRQLESFETERVGKDGRRVPVSLTVSPIRDRSGRVIGASKIARDVCQFPRENSIRPSMFFT